MSIVYFGTPAVPSCGRRLAGGDTVATMPVNVNVEPISAAQLETLLPMIDAYQRFYEVDEIDAERNSSFFAKDLD